MVRGDYRFGSLLADSADRSSLRCYHLGVLRVLPYWFHLAADFCVGLAFIIVPLVLGFKGLDLVFYIVNGAVVLSVVGLHKPAPIKEL